MMEDIFGTRWWFHENNEESGGGMRITLTQGKCEQQ